METTVNLYDELNIKRDLPIEELNRELTQLERIWHQREINQPEKAHKMLGFIIEARKVFRTEQSKAEYDKSLDTSNEDSGDQGDHLKKVAYWRTTANDYLYKNQYDLAEAALKKAFSYPESVDDENLLIVAANVYQNSGKFDRVIECVNNALLLNPDNWQSYALKGITYVDIGRLKQQERYQGSVSADAEQMFKEALILYDLGIAAARKSGNTYGEGFIQGYKAFLLYNTQGKAAAQESLSEAHRLGDPSGQGKAVSGAIEQARQSEYHYSVDCYPCAPIETKEPANGLFYTGHDAVVNEIESALIYVFLGQEVKLAYDSYDIRHQYGGHEIEDREECWYDWHLENEGKVRISLMERAPENFNDGGYCKMTMTYDGSDAGFPAIKEKMDRTLSLLKDRGVEVLQASQIRQLRETRIVTYRKTIGRCQYCCGTFKGLLTKKCSNCGRVKDY